MSSFNWTCPHCDRAVTISENRTSVYRHTLEITNKHNFVGLETRFIVCPNPDCNEFTLIASLDRMKPVNYGFQKSGHMRGWQLLPESKAKHFPDYIPSVVLQDYREACLIRDGSPKASATLSRRCLQGILRDFWGVKPANLVNEIESIKDKVDPVSWAAIDAVRRLGNIGAHMEKDINVVIDVDPGEADLLIELIETLLTEWYVHREERRVRMSKLTEAATSKKPPLVGRPSE
ncbi:Domain of unknown function DUF4145 [Comamonadaceae bacterium]